MSQPATNFESLILSQVSNWEYRLLGDERLLATLEVDDAFDSTMTGEIVGSCRWMFKRTGLIRSSIRAHAEGDKMHSVTLKKSGRGEYTASLPDGKRLIWKRLRDHKSEKWAFLEPDGTSLVVFIPMVTDSGYQSRVQVSIIGQNISNLCLVLLLGGYFLVSRHRDDQLKSFIRSAIVWRTI